LWFHGKDPLGGIRINSESSLFGYGCIAAGTVLHPHVNRIRNRQSHSIVYRKTENEGCIKGDFGSGKGGFNSGFIAEGDPFRGGPPVGKGIVIRVTVSPSLTVWLDPASATGGLLTCQTVTVT